MMGEALASSLDYELLGESHHSCSFNVITHLPFLSDCMNRECVPAVFATWGKLGDRQGDLDLLYEVSSSRPRD